MRLGFKLKTPDIQVEAGVWNFLNLRYKLYSTYFRWFTSNTVRQNNMQALVHFFALCHYEVRRFRVP